jgi:hypothetical protein
MNSHSSLFTHGKEPQFPLKQRVRGQFWRNQNLYNQMLISEVWILLGTEVQPVHILFLGYVPEKHCTDWHWTNRTQNSHLKPTVHTVYKHFYTAEYNWPTLCTDCHPFIWYADSYMFRHPCAIFRELLMSLWVTCKAELVMLLVMYCECWWPVCTGCCTCVMLPYDH